MNKITKCTNWLACNVHIHSKLLQSMPVMGTSSAVSQLFNPRQGRKRGGKEMQGFSYDSRAEGSPPPSLEMKTMRKSMDYFSFEFQSKFSFQPVLHDWCNKGCGMCYPACGMVHIKEPLLLIDKSSLCGGSRFPFSLSEWSLTICLMPYNRR